MNDELDTETIDKRYTQLLGYADAIERLMATDRAALNIHASVMAETVIDARQQLYEMITEGGKGLDGDRATMIMNLMKRYQCLETVLKEIRNNLHGPR